MIVLSRRTFVISAAASAGCLVVSCKTPSSGGASLAGADESGLVPFPNAWIKVSENGTVYYVLDRVEMGQGTMTSHATIVAEELGLEPAKIRVLFAPPAKAYVNTRFGVQVTGSSNSVASSWEPLRMAAAATRMMLIEAGARKMNAPVADCDVDGGSVVHRSTGRKMTFGELAVFAADNVTPPAAPIPRSPTGYKHIGKETKRLDSEAKLRGLAQYGIDVKLPGMLTAVVVRAPQHGGKVETVDEARAKAYWQSVGAEGHVVRLAGGVAAVSTNYWYAKKGAEALAATFSGGKVPKDFTGSMAAVSEAQGLAGKAQAKVDTRGSFASAHQGASKKLSAKYELPFVPHQTMEPMNCTARFAGGELEIWAPTQMPSGAQGVAARITGLPESKVKVNVTHIGGGFGRRIGQDYVAEAAELAFKLKKPVKIVWSREDDMRHDLYRPGTYHVMDGSTGSNGVETFSHKLVAPSVGQHASQDFLAAALPSLVGNGKLEFMGRLVKLGLDLNLYVDPFAAEGADKMPYEIKHVDVRYRHHDTGVPVGFWRSVGHSHNAFAVEGFVDELAESAGVDPLEFRDRMLTGQARDRGVLAAVKSLSRWATQRPDENGKKFSKGVALHGCFGSYCAIVVEVGLKDDKISLENVWAAVDCGFVVNPDIVKAQVEGGIIFGLSAALRQKITFKDGATVEGNFDKCGLLRISECPAIHVEIVGAASQGVKPGGIGEVSVPATAPALVNAIAKATGKRARVLPLGIALAPKDYPLVQPPPPDNPPPPPPDNPPPPPPNGNPLAEKAKDSLKRNCAPCHNPERGDGGINYIDDLPKLVDKKKVRRGEADRKKSRVLVRMKDEDNPMPPKVDENDNVIPRLSDLDIKAIEDWIMNDSPL